jgi:hypothetical protein
MRRTALRLAGAALLTLVALVGVARGHSLAAVSPFPLDLKAKDEGQAVLVAGGPGQGRVWGYWGKLTKPTPADLAGHKWGSYRATCTWLADSSWSGDQNKRDNRFLCTIVLSHRHGPGGHGLPHGGSLVAQGLVKLPKASDGLFVRAHECSSARTRWLAACRPRMLAITGGTGEYEGVEGHVDLSVDGYISIANAPAH